jgi:toxin YoeB
MIKSWHEDAWADYLYWQAQDKRILKKINSLVKDIERNGYNSIGKPEPLKNDFTGWWSTRIDEKNRLVFRLVGETLEIIQCKGHYDNT